MKKNAILLLPVFVLAYSLSASAQGMKKIPVGNSGCSLYTYCDLRFDASKSPDSSQVFAGECTKEEITYGMICVQLANPSEDLVMAEDLLVAYLDFLKGSFGITKFAGYGKGHILNNNKNTRGIIDYWEDKEKHNWKVKGWTDGKFIGVLYAFSLKALPEQKVNVFLDGFRLPEE